ncbi:hypothetical protein KFE94_17375 [bacterium SCSIO 12643]|nr:hypothetical protein KFE94_17375 [bacterium SCSIO 12643]
MKRYFTLAIIATSLFWSSCEKETTNSASKIEILENWTVTKRIHNLTINHRDLFFVNSSTGFIVGYNGEIYKTSNAGQIWQKQNSGTTLHLFSVNFIDPNIGFASGDAMHGCLDDDCDKGAVLLKTINGGRTWVKSFFSQYESIKSLHFFDEMNGLAIIRTPYQMGARSFHMGRTTDGGKSWTLMNLDVKNYDDKFYTTGELVFVPGENQELYRSDDMGVTWKTVVKPHIPWSYVRSMHFYGNLLGFMDGGSSFYKTEDGGLHWEITSMPLNTLDMFHCANDMEWIAIERTYDTSNGGLLEFIGSTGAQTVDEGSHWAHSKLFSDISIVRYHFPEDYIGYGLNNTEFYTIRKK